MRVLEFLTLLFSGLLAGFEIGVHYGIGSPPPSLTEAAQISFRQAMVLRLRILAPVLFLPALASGIILTVRETQPQVGWLHGVALGALGMWITIRALRTVPVNSATLNWNPDMPPAGWRELVRRTERFHVIAAWAAVLAFICFLLPVLRSR